MKTAVYRLAVRMKEIGERMRFRPFVMLGLRLREWVLR